VAEKKRQPRSASSQEGPSFAPPADGLEERPPPHDMQAERSVLGAVLVNADLFDIAVDVIESTHFFRDAHRRIFDAMVKLSEAGKPVDMLLLRTELQRTGQLEEVGGPAYIAGLADGVPRSANIEYYAQIVRDKAQLRAAIQTSQKLSREAYGSEKVPAEILSDAAESLLDLSSVALAGKPTKLGDLVGPGMESLEKSAAEGGGSVTGIASGFTSLDEMTAGLHPGDLVLLAARTSQGKTSLAMNIARNVAFSHNVLVFSLEMSKEQLFLRMLASEARVNSHHMRTGYLQEKDWPRLADAISVLSDLNLYIDDTPSIGVREVRARSRQLRQDKGSLGLVIIDYIQLMRGRGKFDNRQQEIGTISRGLKAVGKELKVPVIALAQLSRAMEAGPGKKARRPQLHDLRESGDLENDADVVVFIYRPESKDDEPVDQAELIIGKQRNGPTGTVKVAWDSSTVSFDNLTMT
jgi:replicative DNA helicase